MNKLKYCVLLPRGNNKHYNIFNSYKFWCCLMDLKARLKKTKTAKEIDIKEEIRLALSYCFCGKVEYEMMAREMFCKECFKIDVYDQVMLNFDMFCTYIIANWRCIPAKTYKQQENERKRKEL